MGSFRTSQGTGTSNQRLPLSKIAETKHQLKVKEKFYCSSWLRKWISNYVIYYHSHTFWKTVCNHAKVFSCLNCKLSGFKICSAIDYSGHYGLSWTSCLVSLNFKLPMCRNLKIIWLAFCFFFFYDDQIKPIIHSTLAVTDHAYWKG